MAESYVEFFGRVTTKEPLPYQQRLAADPFSPTLLVIPTGLGKTDGALMPWLYAKAVGLPSPTRLAYVLPRQNLTRQTAEGARERVKAAGLEGTVRVLELMADSGDNAETLAPHTPAIVVTTQDIFFSRALNRGYARRPPRWPIDFALYNQDCLIVLDEIQLMDDALATSTQLAAFRAQYGTFGAAPCIWMSATVNPEWLRTVDFAGVSNVVRLDDEDRQNEIVQKRLHAPKTLAGAPESCATPAGCAEFALAQHRPGTKTLVVVNTVRRAREVYEAIRSRFESAVLLHSRFRPADRRGPESGEIVVATQVLEAGVDLTADRMITDIAPWGSLVQRFGRVNRYGKEAESEIWWVDRPAHSKQKEWTATPYGAEEIESARQRLDGQVSAAPADLPEEDGPAPWRHVLRRADLLDLFDTSPDLAGNDLDVSRFIRATEERDVYVAWREWPGDGAPPPVEVEDRELCPVPTGELREWLAKRRAYWWNFGEGKWTEADRNRLCPGMTLVVRAAEGGYAKEFGWYPESKAAAPPVPAKDRDANGDGSDRKSFPGYWQTLGAHTRRVVEEVEVLLSTIALPDEAAGALRSAAAKHDWGKAHQVFQETMHRGTEGREEELLAKREGRSRHEVPHFRHELASALAMQATGESALAAYLAAAHHGKVRMSIRSMPGERRQVRGVCEGDVLPACEMGPEVTLSLTCMGLGAEGGSWTERMLGLLEQWGPFRLAYLEMLLRAADSAASDRPEVKEAAHA